MSQAQPSPGGAVVALPLAVEPPHAPNVLLMGEINSGKTRAIRTLVEAGVETFLIATEPNFQDILGDLPPEMLHWHYIQSFPSSMAQLKATAELLQKFDVEAIKKMGGVNKANYKQWFELLEACNNFKDDRTGKEYGDVQKFTNKQALVIDGQKGLVNMATRMLIGDKPFMSWPEMEATQFNIEQFINTLAQGLQCWFVLTAHVDRETDPVTGLLRLMPIAPGKVLAPRIPTFFSEAILCRKTLDGSGKLQWTWDNLTTEAVTKFRNLPPANNHRPDFAPIKKNWEAKTIFDGTANG